MSERGRFVVEAPEVGRDYENGVARGTGGTPDLAGSFEMARAVVDRGPRRCYAPFSGDVVFGLLYPEYFTWDILIRHAD